MKDLQQLLADLKADEDFRNKFVSLGEDEEALNAALAEAGYDVTAADIKAFGDANTTTTELSDEDLEDVAGGGRTVDVTELSEGLCGAIGVGGVGCFA